MRVLSLQITMKKKKNYLATARIEDIYKRRARVRIKCANIFSIFGVFSLNLCNIGIKHDFHSLTFARSRGRCSPSVFNISRGSLRMLMNDKIMFDRYYCINSKKTYRKLRKCLRTLFFSLTTIFLRTHAFYKYPRFGPWPGTFSHDDLKA